LELKRKFQAALSDNQINDSKVPTSSHVCNVYSQRLAKFRLKLHKSQTHGKGSVKTCITMKKGKELNKNMLLQTT